MRHAVAQTSVVNKRSQIWDVVVTYSGAAAVRDKPPGVTESGVEEWRRWLAAGTRAQGGGPQASGRKGPGRAILSLTQYSDSLVSYLVTGHS